MGTQFQFELITFFFQNEKLQIWCLLAHRTKLQTIVNIYLY